MYTASEPISNPEDLLFLQDQWVTADIALFYDRLRPFVNFGIEPDEGLLVIDFDTDHQQLVERILSEFGCQWKPAD